MKRLLAIALVLVLAGYSYEKISGHGIGVSRTMGWVAAGFNGTMGGGYGVAASVTQSVLGILPAVAGVFR